MEASYILILFSPLPTYVVSFGSGTLIRVFDTHSGELLKELRRGMERAVINCISFSKTSEHLACSSDKGTVHIFTLAKRSKSSEGRTQGSSASEEAAGEQAPNNATSNLSMLRRIIPAVPKYVDSEWSFAQIHGLESHTICAFGQDLGSIIVVGADGSYLHASFVAGGECEKVSFAKFVR